MLYNTGYSAIIFIRYCPLALGPLSESQPPTTAIYTDMTAKTPTDPVTTEAATTESTRPELEDRSFEGIADHFEKKVYGGLKGAIRLAVLRRDLGEQVARLSAELQRPLRILDVGAGLAQLSIELAQQGHEVTINDISNNMLSKAKALALAKIDDATADTESHPEATEISEIEDELKEVQAQDSAVEMPDWLTRTEWLVCPYQALEEQLTGQYDLILCHALLEWLAQPQDIMDFFDKWLAKHGVLSLCFYNPVSFDYRNLIMGNFNLLNNSDYQSDNKKTLTPNHPVPKEEVTAWLAARDYQILGVSGLRVFHDYSPLKRGGHNHPDAVIEMELRYSSLDPYKWMGRYLHYLASPTA